MRGVLNKKSVPVVQYDLNGNFIKRWAAMHEIERECGFLKEAISRHCRGSKLYSHAYGFLWRLEKDVLINGVIEKKIKPLDFSKSQIKCGIKKFIKTTKTNEDTDTTGR